MPLENPDQFERIRVDVAGCGVTITTWFDGGRKAWRANAPAWLSLLGEREEDLITGATRERAIQAIRQVLAHRFALAADRR